MISIAKPLIGAEEKQAVSEVLDSGMIACGPKTKEFEEEFANFVGTKYAVATNSGTASLHIALLSLGIREGDEVIVPSFSFIATANSVLFCNAKPVFCDINSKTFNIDINKIEKLITDKTKAIMPVHLYGQPADMKPILEVAEKYGLYVIGDAAQAHGAKYDNKMIGSFGDVECFSFYPTKNMTTGEGGMVTTNSEKVAERAYSIRNHGREKTKCGYGHNRLGYNYRMTDIAAAIGIEQLKKLPKFNERRKENAKYLNKKLDEMKGIETPYALKNVEHVYHQYTIKCKDREKLIQKLKENGIGYGIYYPKPLHSYKHLKGFAHDDLKNSEEVAKEVISLPVHPSLTKDDLEKIVEAIT
ncbi:MAG: DegT/DnrJ/EryC1/StrS family aminotransferase [Candidatus Thermoplasmatota archaeon]|nr:DegT/DnrJ/EryC1/StrS family aminotransferase [Candidatus Thermoplasmatota archaeon]